MRCTFVSGIWGDRSDPRFRRKIVRDVSQPVGRNVFTSGHSGASLMQELGAIVYTFSEDAYDLAKANGLQPVPLEYPLPEHPSQHVQWHQKLIAMEEALRTHEHVVWVDIDIIRLRPLPEEFWSALEGGAPIQSRLQQYKRRKCHWREEHIRKIHGGAFIYCRSPNVLARVRAVMTQGINEQWNIDDEIAITYVCDELLGSWEGLADWQRGARQKVAEWTGEADYLETFRQAGFDTPWYETIRGDVFTYETRAVFTAR